MGVAEGYLQRVWKDAKTWRSIRLGPITLHFRLGRSNSRRPCRALTPAPNVRPTLHDSASAQARAPETAVVVGMGAEIGPALVRKLTNLGTRVAVVSRSELRGMPEHQVRSFSCDVTCERSTKRVFADIIAQMG